MQEKRKAYLGSQRDSAGRRGDYLAGARARDNLYLVEQGDLNGQWGQAGGAGNGPAK